MEFINGWSGSARRDASRLHSICSYMAMFPAAIPRYFIEKCTRPQDVVLDPFAGRGTTPLEACLLGRCGVGNDLNPLAHSLTQAKVRVPSYTKVLSRIADLEREYAPLPCAGELLNTYGELSAAAVERQRGRPSDGPGLDRALWERLTEMVRKTRRLYAEKDPRMPHFEGQEYEFRAESAKAIGYDETCHHRIWLFYHPETLRQMVYFRENLGSSPEDRFIKALILGIMHGRGRHYLSLPMPNTFSMTPRYVLAYSYKNLLVLPLKDLFVCLRRKMALLDPVPTGYTPGASFQGDVRDLPSTIGQFLESCGRRPRLLVSSPPYLGVIKYGQYNWIRLWFLDEQSETPAVSHKPLDKQLDALLDDGHHNLEGYLAFMKETLASVAEVMMPGAVNAWVIGDVGDVNLAEAVWEKSAKPLGYRRLALITDEIDEGKKVTKIWGKGRGRATKIDRVLVLSNP